MFEIKIYAVRYVFCLLHALHVLCVHHTHVHAYHMFRAPAVLLKEIQISFDRNLFSIVRQGSMQSSE